MKIGHLKEILTGFDDASEVSLLMGFPELADWSVSTCDIGTVHGEEDGSLQLEASVFLADFDYPEILEKLKDIAAATPKEKCAKG